MPKVRPRSVFVAPCIPTRALKPPAGPDWVHEIKHDGYRLQVRRDGDAVRLFTRKGYGWSDRYPAIAVTAVKLRARSFTLDGEACVCRPDGVAVFDALHRHGTVREAMLYAFDLLELDGDDLPGLPLSDRKWRLVRLVGRRTLRIVLSEHTDEDGATIFQQACRMGLEGIVSKRLSAPYRSGPSLDWLKINPDSIVGFRVRLRPLVAAPFAVDAAPRESASDLEAQPDLPPAPRLRRQPRLHPENEGFNRRQQPAPRSRREAPMTFVIGPLSDTPLVEDRRRG
jgi:bifunctional non-homologous end joining protein LigD